MYAVTSQNLLGRSHAGTINQAMNGAKGGKSDANRLTRVVLAADVRFREARIGPQLFRARQPLFGVDVDQHDLATSGEQGFCGRQAEAGTTASDQKYGILDTHVALLSRRVRYIPTPGLINFL
ncbi:hypothetical protein D3C81_929540 [compost metagenome]